MNQIDENQDSPGTGSTRKELFRKVVVFQFKLFVDGLRDLVLVPVSLIAAALDLLSGTDSRSGNFASIMNLGRRSEHYIDLFGERENLSSGEMDHGEEPGLGELLGTLETRVKERYRKDGAAASAQEALEALRKAAGDLRKAGGGDGSNSHPDH